MIIKQGKEGRKGRAIETPGGGGKKSHRNACWGGEGRKEPQKYLLGIQ